MSNSRLKICSVQAEFSPVKMQHNFRSLKTLIDRASDGFEPDLVVIPENFVMIGPVHGRKFDAAAALEFLQETAAEFEIILVGGSFHHLDQNNGRYLNSCYIIDSSGNIAGEYHKRKLFDREIHHRVTPGDQNTIIDIGGWKIGILICADLWYPELCREMEGEIDVLAVPAQSIVRSPDYQEYGRKLWHSLALTRSQENSIVVAVSDHSASMNTPFACGGASICDPSASMSENTIESIQLTIDDGSAGFIKTIVDRESLDQFRKYRRQRGLLPDEKVQS